MPHVPFTRAGVVAPILAELERCGAPVDHLMAAAGLPACARVDPEVLIPSMSTARLLAGGARAQMLDDLGLRAGERARLDDLGIFGDLIRAARTVRDAVETAVNEYASFSSDGMLSSRARGGDVELSYVPLDEHAIGPGPRHAEHYFLMLMLQVVRLGADPTWCPAEVHLRTGGVAVVRAAESFEGARVSFGRPETMVAIPAAVLAEPLRSNAAHPRLPQQIIAAWRRSGPARDFVESIVHAVETLSWDGYPDIRRTAVFLGTSVRTLQRHLAAAGISHESLVGRARFATAAAVLEETDMKLLDIALDLGYSDHAHFTRAFRRWAGCSPQEYRRRHRQQQAGSKPSVA